MSIFAGKTLMITGGTGSFGNAVLNRFLRTDIGEIRIFSRDEKKQDDMRHEYQMKYPDDGVALCLELCQVVDHLAAEECGAVFKGWLVDDDLSTLSLDTLHDALNGRLAEVVAV